MSRKCADWLTSFCEYASYGEAPRRMYFWTGVSTLAGALRRKVWIDQAYFRWQPNFYIILVAPPGIVSKSTTADVGMSLLRQVSEIKFGPSVVTWQALVQSFSQAIETFFVQGELQTMSPMTIASSEFGNLLNPQDRDMVDMLVNLWDGKPFTKHTKMSGTDTVVNPWINIIACTTPEWIAGSFPEYMIGGGFTSRCVFVYAETKEKYVAYPGLQVPTDLKAQEEALVHDLEHISVNLAGEYRLTPEAIEWGTAWYRVHYERDAKRLEGSRYGGYVARKQTHIHKLAMVLAASCRDELIITLEDLQTAYTMVTDLEKEMPKVFDKIGMKEESQQLERLVLYINGKGGQIPYTEVYRFLQHQFPYKRDLENAVEGLIASGRLVLFQRPDGFWVKTTEGASKAQPEPRSEAPNSPGSAE